MLRFVFRLPRLTESTTTPSAINDIATSIPLYIQPSIHHPCFDVISPLTQSCPLLSIPTLANTPYNYIQHPLHTSLPRNPPNMQLLKHFLNLPRHLVLVLFLAASSCFIHLTLQHDLFVASNGCDVPPLIPRFSLSGARYPVVTSLFFVVDAARCGEKEMRDTAHKNSRRCMFLLQSERAGVRC